MSEPKEIIVCKADEKEIPGVILKITEILPDFLFKPLFKPLKRIEDFYDNQAQAVAYALFSSLPQGTLDRVIIKLMEHKVSVYRGKAGSQLIAEPKE